MKGLFWITRRQLWQTLGLKMLFPLLDGPMPVECRGVHWVPCSPLSLFSLETEHCTGNPLTLPVDDGECSYSPSESPALCQMIWDRQQNSPPLGAKTAPRNEKPEDKAGAW